MGKIGRIVQSQTCYRKVVLIKSDNYHFLIFYIEIDYIDYYSCNRHLILSFRLRSEFFNKRITTNNRTIEDLLSERRFVKIGQLQVQS